jgi:hypothetical protein
MIALSERRPLRLLERGWLVGALYAAIGLAAYASTFDVFFMSDDFDFLGIVAPAGNVLVIFEPLVGRFVRPLVVLMYYGNFHSGGLAVFGYHLWTVIPHLVNAWLVYLVARRLMRDDEAVWPFLIGLLFLLFAGHSEAVSWPAGIADPILTVFLLAAFLFYLRALEPGASRGWLAAMFAAVLAGTQAKEMWVVFPGVLVVHAIAFGVWRDGRLARRAIVAIAGTSALVGAYLLMRHLVFGSVAGGYSGLGLSLHAGLWHTQARAFVLRCFVPAHPVTARVWLERWDLLGWAMLAVAVLLLARGPRLRAIVFAGGAMIVALVPVLPLTISVSSTESERFTYLPTTFSCMFMVWVIAAVVRHRAAAVALCLLATGIHTVGLARSNRIWEVSGTLTRQILDGFAVHVQQHDPNDTAMVFLLNLPDNVAGAYVFRNGFYPGVRVVHPEVASRIPRTFGIATQSLVTPRDMTRVRRLDARRFHVDVAPNAFLQDPVPSGFHYQVTSQTRTSYEVEFSDAIGAAVVLYLTGGRLELAGTVTGRGIPFGTVDIPLEGATCEGTSVRFAGWALDDQRVARVTLREMAPNGEEAASLGEAAWARGERPDVARIFAAFPDADRASWSFEVPCAAIARTGRDMMRIRVTAQDEAGHTAVLGERMVRTAR